MTNEQLEELKSAALEFAAWAEEKGWSTYFMLDVCEYVQASAQAYADQLMANANQGKMN